MRRLAHDDAPARRSHRGTIQTTLTEGERRVPLAELERAGLLPDAELKDLRRRVELLTDELTTYRQLVVSTEREAEAERQAREQLEAALFERQAAATRAEAAAAQAEQKAADAAATGDELRALEADLRAAGPIKGLEACPHPPQGRRRGLRGVPETSPRFWGNCWIPGARQSTE